MRNLLPQIALLLALAMGCQAEEAEDQFIGT